MIKAKAIHMNCAIAFLEISDIYYYFLEFKVIEDGTDMVKNKI